MLEKPNEAIDLKDERQSTPTETAEAKSLDRFIRLEASPVAKVYSIKMDVICNVCGKTWGIRLLPDGRMPFSWFECLSCKKNKNNNENQPLGKVEKSDGNSNL